MSARSTPPLTPPVQTAFAASIDSDVANVHTFSLTNPLNLVRSAPYSRRLHVIAPLSSAGEGRGCTGARV